MAVDLRQRMERIESKAQLLTERYHVVLNEKQAANKRIAELEATVQSMLKEIESLKQELEFQRIATTISPSREDVDRSRAVLSGLVREIDNCINELKD